MKPKKNTCLATDCKKKFDYRSNKLYCSKACGLRQWAKNHPRIKTEEIHAKNIA